MLAVDKVVRMCIIILLCLQEIFVDGFIPLTEGKLFYMDDQHTNWKRYQFYIKTIGLYMCKSGQTWVESLIVHIYAI